MNSPHPRRLAFEILEPKASPSSLLLVLAPLDEPQQQVIECERTMYATATSTATNDANVALLQFIERNTCGNADVGSAITAPTRAQAAAADRMMQATDTDLRSMLITELLEENSADGAYVYTVLQF